MYDPIYGKDTRWIASIPTCPLSSATSAINNWYTNIWYAVDYMRTDSTEDSVIRSQLSNTTLWTPALLAVRASNISNYGFNPYDTLQQMIRNYSRFSYHVYPNPKDDGIYGYLENNQWPRFPSWLQTWIDTQTVSTGGNFFSIIDEFGWEPAVMKNQNNWACGQTYTQDDIWWNHIGCGTRDGTYHFFENDIQGFISWERHNALTVNAWITSGWLDSNEGNSGVDRADGIVPSTGDIKRWLDNYRQQTY